ncbi:hypothetical protein vseg_001228 [Gypsophila vaccaria]
MCYSKTDDSQLQCCSPSTDEDTVGLMLASDYPKKRAGRKKFKETRHPIFRGVRQRSSGKWVSEVRQPNNKNGRIWLGTYLTADMAARAADVAVLALRGTHGACLNFADSVWRLPVPASSDTKDIQKAAALAADAFRPVVAAAVAVAVAVAVAGEPEMSVEYVDDDMVFGMNGLIADMYEGLMMSPPRGNYSYDQEYDRLNEGADVSLWSYCF